uniref:Retrovirus-related Pol polyprotein from transposon RE1 n=2 Tax=Vitis vinifera TaxID=29760 RepID=A5BIJ4_VITVI|nr:hypothetical protein VITISV_002861 [Vitis vinifera]
MATNSNNLESTTLVTYAISNQTTLITINVVAQLPLKLVRGNYASWCAQFDSLLYRYDPVGYVDGSFLCPLATIQATPTSSPEPNPAYKLWMRQDNLLSLTIIGSQILNLKTTLARTNMDTMSVSEYLMTIKHMADELALIGASLSEDEILLHVLNGLSPKYKELGVVMCVRDTPISFEELHDKLIEHEIYLKRDMEMKEIFNAIA